MLHSERSIASLAEKSTLNRGLLYNLLISRMLIEIAKNAVFSAI